MTKKDYIAIARALNVQLVGWTIAESPDAAKIVAGIADEISDLFAADNPRFDRARFLQACGVTA
jgi:hypothetical protein